MIGELPATVSEDDKGAPTLPPERFANYGEVQTFCKTVISADESKRAKVRAKVDGIINGNQPINPWALKAKNMGWYPNVNFREAEGKIASLFAIYYDLVNECYPCIDIDLDYGEGQETEDWAESIECNWTWLLQSRWRKQWNYHLSMQVTEMIKHGLGAHVWPAPGNNWIPRTPKSGHILFEEEAPFNFDSDGESFVLRDFVPLHALYAFVRNEAAAKKLGWRPDAVWKLMAQTSKAAQDRSKVEELQSAMKRGDYGQSAARQSGAWVNWCPVRELDTGKIALYAVPEKLDVGDYLFKKRNAFDEWPLALFPLEAGHGTIHSVRGIGAKDKDFFEVSNRVKNTMLAQVILSATILLQPNGTIDPDKLKLAKLGMMSILPQNLQIAQGVKFPDLSQGPLALLQHLEQTRRDNSESYTGGVPDPRDRETAQSFTMRAQDAAQVTKGSHGLYCSNLRHLYNKMFRMCVKAGREADRGERTPEYVKLAKEFLKRCKDDGVPDEAFDHIVEIREVTSTGAGSPAARVNGLTTIIQSPVYQNASEDKKVNIERDYTSAVISGVKVDRYARSQHDNELPNQDDSFATLESDALSKGGNAQMATTQNHVKHVQNHLGKAQEILTALQQGQIAPEEALGGIQAIGHHVAQHLQQLQGNVARKAEFEQLKQDWMALSAIADKLQQQVDEAQQAQAQPSPQERVSEGLQVGLAKVQADSQIKGAKLQTDTALKVRKQTVAEALKFRDQAFRHRLEASKPKLALTNG